MSSPVASTILLGKSSRSTREKGGNDIFTIFSSENGNIMAKGYYLLMKRETFHSDAACLAICLFVACVEKYVVLLLGIYSETSVF